MRLNILQWNIQCLYFLYFVYGGSVCAGEFRLSLQVMSEVNIQSERRTRTLVVTSVQCFPLLHFFISKFTDDQNRKTSENNSDYLFSLSPASGGGGVVLSQQPVRPHASFSLHLNLSSELQLEAAELLQNLTSGLRHVNPQSCRETTGGQWVSEQQELQ